MDFDPGLVSERGYGAYEPLDPGLLPPLLIAHQSAAAQPSDEAHAEVRGRFRAGDAEVEAAMAEIAALASRAEGCELLEPQLAKQTGRPPRAAR
jgi:hypothetical protein